MQNVREIRNAKISQKMQRFREKKLRKFHKKYNFPRWRGGFFKKAYIDFSDLLLAFFAFLRNFFSQNYFSRKLFPQNYVVFFRIFSLYSFLRKNAKFCNKFCEIRHENSRIFSRKFLFAGNLSGDVFYQQKRL